MKWLEKLRKKLSDICDIGEFLMGLIVVIGIGIALIGLIPDLVWFWSHRNYSESFMEFLESASLIVIGIEFAKMLCKPNTSNIIEALIFLIARQMIISHAGAKEILLSVISICLLFLFRRIMLVTKPDKMHHVPNIIKAIKLAQTKEFQRALQEVEQSVEEEKKKENYPDMDDFGTD